MAERFSLEAPESQRVEVGSGLWWNVLLVVNTGPPNKESHPLLGLDQRAQVLKYLRSHLGPLGILGLLHSRHSPWRQRTIEERLN